jgi:DNA-binding MarR family transcriptional regulator
MMHTTFKNRVSTGSKGSDTRTQLLPLMFEMGRLLKREICSDGVDVPSFLHIETLRYIEEQGTPSMRDIAEYLKIAPPSATALINSFVKDGILERVTDVADRRVVRLQLSRKGEITLAETMRKRAEAFSRVVSHLSENDCAELVRILSVITRPSVTTKLT